MRFVLSAALLALSAFTIITAAPQRCEAQAFDGYTLFAPSSGRTTYLVDMNKKTMHTWTHTRNGGYSYYLLEDGSLLRSAMASSPQINGGGATGVIQRYNWAGTVTWEYTYSSSTYIAHHDVCALPNGNVLFIAWEVKNATQAEAAGLNRASAIWPDHLVEVQPTGASGGNIVWQWHAWDHLVQDHDATKANYGVVAEHPELLNINMGAGGMGPGIGGGDWMHINALSYNPALDQIVISSHTLDEVYVIDHSTTTAEAASHSGGRWGKGGDILYRWGRPSNYGAPGAQVFDVVHCAAWIPAGLPGAGHILAFNNGETIRRSTVVELVPPTDAQGNYVRGQGQAFGPAASLWSYTASDFYSTHLGGNQRLPNGNTLMAESTSGNLFECDSSGKIVWSYLRGGEIIRALRYAPTYPGVQRLLAASTPEVLPSSPLIESISPNPVTTVANLAFRLPERMAATITVTDQLGRTVATIADAEFDAGEHHAVIDAAALPAGMYYCRMVTSAGTATRNFARIP
jgi:hypothetical protein